MGDDSVVALGKPEGIEDALTELIRTGARQLIERAVEAELEELLVRFGETKTADGRAGIVRNGHHPERQIATGVGPVTVKIPKVRSRVGEPVAFQSALVPPYVRRSRSVDAAIPWLYLKGVAAGEMGSALEVLVGADAKGLSANVVGRLKRQWQSEYETWRQRRLDQDRWVYLWVDGIYSGLRAESAKLCVLVVIGVNERGEKHFLAIEDGVRESKQSWREVLIDLKARGLEQPPELAVGDGALGFWAALSEVYPTTREQRCWMHKTGNVLNYLPKSVQPKAKQALQAIWMAETRQAAHRAFDQFVETYDAKYPKATSCLVKDRDALLAFYDFPAEHWVHLRTTNPIESTFATIRHRTDRAKGCVTRDTMLAMIFKLGVCAEQNWRKIRGFKHVAKVIEGVRFIDGIEQIDANDQSKQAA
jgi:transposase-like protein